MNNIALGTVTILVSIGLLSSNQSYAQTSIAGWVDAAAQALRNNQVNIAYIELSAANQYLSFLSPAKSYVVGAMQALKMGDYYTASTYTNAANEILGGYSAGGNPSSMNQGNSAFAGTGSGGDSSAGNPSSMNQGNSAFAGTGSGGDSSAGNPSSMNQGNSAFAGTGSGGYNR
jgi:hypothetical protein